MIKSKKSQITVFIIIGVILLFSTALVLYIKGQVQVTERQIKVPVEQVPTEMQPVQAFVTSCLEQTATKAFNLIGTHGGYIGTDSGSYDYTGFNFKTNEFVPTEADVIAFPPKSSNYVPYWEYMLPPDTCEACYISSFRPPLYRTEGGNSIETQVDKYVQNNLRICLANFEKFKSEGYSIKETGGMKATTFVRENDVFIDLNYSLEVSKTGIEKITMSRYQATLPIRFKKIYDIAANIIEISQNSRFLGLTTLNLISGFSRVDKNALPPFAALEFTYDSVTWSKENIKKLIVQMLEAYVPVIQMEGTGNFRTPADFDDPFMKGLYGGMVLPGKAATDMRVNFIYLGWPIYLNFVGSTSDLLKPSSLEMPLLDLLPYRDYRFVYDLSYPVIARVSDPEAFSGKGYSFVFAMEANIRNNNAIGNGTLTIPAISGGATPTSEFCNELHRNSGNITVRTTDAETGQPLEDVNLIFRGSQQCSVGMTSIDGDEMSSSFGEALMTSQFPVGLGTLILSKPGYVTRYEKYGTSVGTDDDVSFSLVPIKILSANVQKKKIVAPGTLGLPENLLPADMAIVNIEKKIPEGSEEEPMVSAVISGGGMNGSNITIAPGKYKVTVTFILNRTVTIPEEKICNDMFFGLIEKCATIPETVFANYVFPPTEYVWEVKQSDFSGAGTVNFTAKFFALYADPPTSHEGLKTTSDKFELFKNNLNYFQFKPQIAAVQIAENETAT